jgi:hypothetical protein
MINHFSTISMIDSIRVLLNLGAAQGKQAFTLDIKNAFQKTIEFNPRKRTYITLAHFFVDCLCLRWANHQDFVDVEQDPSTFVNQNVCFMQGQKDAGPKFYMLISNYLRHIGMRQSISDHIIFI